MNQTLRDLISRTRAADLSDRLLFLPEVPVWDMPEFYQALDIYVAPQRWEGFGLTPLEAMACGAPTIATRAGAFEETIIHGQTGTLIEAGEVDALVNALQMLLSDPIKLATYTRNARTHMVQNFPLQTEADALNAVYRQLLRC